MKKIFTSTLFCLWALAAVAQNIVTPGTGVNWNLDSLVQHFPGSVSKISPTEFQMSDSLEVAANDTLMLTKSLLIWRIDSGMLVRVYGTFISDAGGSMIGITGPDTAKPFYGFRFEEFSTARFYGTSIMFGGGLRVLTEDFVMDGCDISHHSAGAATGAAVNFSRGRPVVMNSIFRNNELPAFASGANQEVGARLLYNLLEGNGQSNSNRPQINMGPSGINDTTYVIGNTIIGDRSLTNVGGISVSSLLGIDLNAVIDSNIVKHNRYGITMAGGKINGLMRANIIDSNNTQGNPMLGGSGISLNSNTQDLKVVASHNEISNNLWGITLIGSAAINLGDTNTTSYNEGKNSFTANGNGGSVYALYNNTSLPVMALNNCWESDTTLGLTAEDVIFHKTDDGTLGEVTYNPVWDCQEDSGVGLTLYKAKHVQIYPNPSAGTLHIDVIQPGIVEVYDLKGTQVYTTALYAGANKLQLPLAPGIYVLKIGQGAAHHIQKMVVQ